MAEKTEILNPDEAFNLLTETLINRRAISDDKFRDCKQNLREAFEQESFWEGMDKVRHDTIKTGLETLITDLAHTDYNTYVAMWFYDLLERNREQLGSKMRMNWQNPEDRLVKVECHKSVRHMAITYD